MNTTTKIENYYVARYKNDKGEYRYMQYGKCSGWDTIEWDCDSPLGAAHWGSPDSISARLAKGAPGIEAVKIKKTTIIEIEDVVSELPKPNYDLYD